MAIQTRVSLTRTHTHSWPLLSFFIHPVPSMSQSPPHSTVEVLDPSSATLSDQGATQAPAIDNLDQCLDGEVSAARGVGAFTFGSLQCMPPSWLTRYPTQIPPYRKSGNAKSPSSPQPHNRMTPCVTLVPPHPGYFLAII